MRNYLTADDFEGLSGDGLAEACLACSARFAPMFAAFTTRSDPRDYDDLVGVSGVLWTWEEFLPVTG